ncbi:recombinase family protein [Bradyrhizobium erythrophlei]|uniref:Site-specific DNA recombinase n=1 Tax=Bradyrhizobium erythrophlei TaxID=1437360 RepID=A0A1M7UCN7_9BRAD|nr:recombinase family protein [Bradyrhizobium erythrophlei]SHN80812.1 Site-specific DNA recombinase [Bradyrhizobium erythrophlei]
MKAGSPQKVRCAIYTRVSTDQGLDQDFNSLDAQYEASSAYIKSQAHAGWTLIRSRYDDGGYSGGSTDRPHLQRLLEDIRSRKIDVIVVYKVDRLTRSLADFAKLVELFDAHGVSFVSVTQQFNTTTSMGRLTLNVLLSFAQFEREVTSERIRDKIAASKRKGLWVGGPLPLGYELKDSKLLIVDEEAERVRLIFRRYLEVSGINELARDLKKKEIHTKARTFSTGKTRGGIPFGRGTLTHLLRNRFFIGEVEYKGEILPGEQPAIMDRSLFDAVQKKLSTHQSHKTLTRQKSDHLLKDLLFDDAGHRMIATHATKAGVRYRYYASQPSLHGEARTAKLGSVSRVPATEIEKAIVSAIRQHLSKQPPLGNQQDLILDQTTLISLISYIEVKKTQLAITLKPIDEAAAPEVVSTAWQKPPFKRSREILLPHGTTRENIRPDRAERRARLVSAIARGRCWLDEIVSGSVIDAEQLAKRERCTVRQVNLTLSLAFLTPPLVKAAVEGRLPRGINIERLRDPDVLWSRQFQDLGLSSN